MVGVTTVALLERKPTISRDLFSRYWRDVHGVMAARIPGFDSYVQHHVTPVDAASEPFEGIAVVGFASEDDRIGLATSAMTGHIHRDEQNVFRRALLYNLPGEVHVMVLGGRATSVGLRGLNAVRTIPEAGAENQLDRCVEDALYRLGGATSA